MTVVVQNFAELLRASAAAEKGVQREVRAVFRTVGEEIRQDWERSFSNYNATRSHTVSARGVKVKVRQRGIDVEQTKRRTTGRHPEYAEAQVRHGRDPAILANEPRFLAAVEDAITQVERIFQRGH